MTQIPKAARVRFLDALARTGNLPVAYDAAGVSRHRLNVLRKDDAEFAELWDEAIEAGLERLEGEAMQRALEGIEETVYYHGEQIDTVRRYSDRLLIFLLKTLRPEKYGDKATVDTEETDDSLTRFLEQVMRDSQEADEQQKADEARRREILYGTPAGPSRPDSLNPSSSPTPPPDAARRNP